ncbi:MAG: hypothetical protein RMJ67_01330 [Elusimicrobiota bacterium]|nr:hypothetical protein [Endomicrobiia bacterium]MDW8165146.1 hypothetical protein [Elusimicrobiota bacterium]
MEYFSKVKENFEIRFNFSEKIENRYNSTFFIGIFYSRITKGLMYLHHYIIFKNMKGYNYVNSVISTSSEFMIDIHLLAKNYHYHIAKSFMFLNFKIF